MDQTLQNKLKKEAGIKAAQLVKDGMVVGLGTGSTVRYLVDELGRRVQEEGLKFTGTTTSRRTAKQAEGYGIKIVDIDDVDHMDITIDGADEVDKNFNGIKGGGAALLWEKIVAINSNYYVWIVDSSKRVDTIGKFPLPVEVIPFGAGHVIKRMEKKGYKPVLRLGEDGKPIRTDENNYIVPAPWPHRSPAGAGQTSSTWSAWWSTAHSSTWSMRVIVGNEGEPLISRTRTKEQLSPGPCRRISPVIRTRRAVRMWAGTVAIVLLTVLALLVAYGITLFVQARSLMMQASQAQTSLQRRRPAKRKPPPPAMRASSPPCAPTTT